MPHSKGLMWMSWNILHGLSMGICNFMPALEIGMSAGKGGGGAARMLDMLPALCACASHEGDKTQGGTQEFKRWATLKRQPTPPVGTLPAVHRACEGVGEILWNCLGSLLCWCTAGNAAKEESRAQQLLSGSCREQVKSCTVHTGAGSTQKRGSGVGHHIKEFAFFTSPPHRFIEDPHREPPQLLAAGGHSQQQEALAGVAVEIANHCFPFITAPLEILGQEQWQQTCTGHPSSPTFGMPFQPGRSEDLNPPCRGLPVEGRLPCLSCCCPWCSWDARKKTGNLNQCSETSKS